MRKRFLERTLRNRPPETAGKFEERYEEYLRNRREIEEWYTAGKVNIVEVSTDIWSRDAPVASWGYY